MTRHILVDERVYYRFAKFCRDWGFWDTDTNSPDFDSAEEHLLDTYINPEDLPDVTI